MSIGTEKLKDQIEVCVLLIDIHGEKIGATYTSFGQEKKTPDGFQGRRTLT